MNFRKLTHCFLAGAIVGCAANPEGDEPNPFLTELDEEGKFDTAYYNPDGIEVEVDLEAEIEGASSWQLADGPAIAGQFALTYLRKKGGVFLESLAEDSTQEDRAEWLVGERWLPTSQARTAPGATLKRFRLRGINAVLLHSAARGVTVGKVITAKVPKKPLSIYADAGKKCADDDDHITLGQDVYWYRWEPSRSSCPAALQQEMKVTVSKLFARGKTIYPEYDRLFADKKLTVVVLFGQIDDGPITENETGIRSLKQMSRNLTRAGFSEVAAPLGKRFSKLIRDITVEMDLYSPRDFSGLGDYAHFDNFRRAISEHEIIVFDGHSMLGASDFWSRQTYPDNYQIFMYGGCLGYEYYVRPIVQGKHGWKNVDILSSVVEVSVTANDFAAPMLSKIFQGISKKRWPSWQSLVSAVRAGVGDSTFGVSGVRDNCYAPSGSRCP
ncbi:MAG: hypothetical protein HYY84_03885 [Deltaproteobacteria bacterium]|nr:hypothetical protein [Deltaproteobacteria bacterium]